MPGPLSRGLAHALLAGAAAPAPARARCATTLGRDFDWLAALVGAMIERFGSRWHLGSLTDLAEAIDAHESLHWFVMIGHGFAVHRCCYPTRPRCPRHLSTAQFQR